MSCLKAAQQECGACLPKRYVHVIESCLRGMQRWLQQDVLRSKSKDCGSLCWLQVTGAWGADLRVVVAGLTNTYSSYITTFEEYGVQRYEGASTIFGPHTLDAYIQVP